MTGSNQFKVGFMNPTNQEEEQGLETEEERSVCYRNITVSAKEGQAEMKLQPFEIVHLKVPVRPTW